MSELFYADDIFYDCESAIEALCIGCPDERGWSFANENIPEPLGSSCCMYMINDVTDNESPCVFIKDGEPYCIFRHERFDQPEMDKYKKRMRGDWT